MEVVKMQAFQRYCPSHTTIAAYLALFVALGGTSYAVATGSIDSREIKDNTVASRDIRNGEISSRDVKNRSLLPQDFKPFTLPSGPRGPEGPRGETGSPGAPGSALAFAHVNADGTLDAGRSKNVVSVRRGAGPGFPLSFLICFTLTAQPQNAVATPDSNQPGNVPRGSTPVVTIEVPPGRASSSCDPGSHAVGVLSRQDGLNAEFGFFVVFN